MIQADCSPVEAICNTLYDYAEHLRCQAMDALDGCFDGGCDGKIRSYLTMGSGDDGIPDALTVAIGPFTPSAGTASVGPSVYQAQFDVRLRESGYPMVQAAEGGRSIAYPDPQLQHAATRRVMGHAGAILGRLSMLKANGGLAPEGYRCSRGVIGSMVPLPAQGGVSGFSITVVLNLPWG